MRRKIRYLRLIIGSLFLLFYVLYILNSNTVTVQAAGEITTANTENGLLSNGAEAASNEIHAFYPAYVSFSEQLQGYIDDVNSVSFAWGRFETSDPGYLNKVRGLNGNYDFYYPKDFIQPVTYAKSKGKSIQLSIFMSGKGSANSLPDENIQSSMIQSIVQLMQQDITNGNGIYFDGVVIDFEGLKDTDSSKKPILYNGLPISTYYIEFLTNLKEALQPMGKKLYVAINVRDYFDGFNYAEILKVADKVILMAHSYDPTSSVLITKNQALQYTGEKQAKVNSLAPILKVQKALMDMQTAASDPSDLKKVLLQICFDSAQWKFDVKTPDDWAGLNESTLSRSGKSSPSYKTMKALIDNTQGYASDISYGYNNVLQSPFIQYFNNQDYSWNVIIYEDSNSITAKIDLVQSMGMGGISLWSLSNVPDYNDLTGLKFHMDSWVTIIAKMKPEPITYITFTDPGIEQAVRKKLGKMDSGITLEDLHDITALTLSKGVESLDDLTMLVNLKALDARNLNIKDITALGSLPKLKWVNLNYNQISDISPLKSLKKLDSLYLNNNRITSLKSLSGLTSLQKLALRGNKITYITALSKLTSLKVLNLGDNSITYIKPLSGLNNLIELRLNKNLIPKLDALVNLTSLQTLDLRDNKISKIAPLKGLKKLQRLSVKGNSIKDYISIKILYSKKGFVCDFIKR